MIATELYSRPYAGLADLESVIDFLLTCRAEEDLDPWPPIHEIRARLREHGGGAPTRLWEDAEHQIVACALIWEGSILLACMHPMAQDETLETQLIAWGMDRVQRIAQAHGERAALYIPVRDDDHHRIAMLERQGFSQEDWRNLRMMRRLAAPIAAPGLPAGFTLRPVAGAAEAEAHVALHRDAFVTAQITVDERLALLRDPAYHPDLDLVVVAPGGTLAAFCLASFGVEENTRTHRALGWIDLLGTRHAYRRRGIGRALMLTALQRLQAYGLDRALLNTGSWNYEAHRLFAACDFHVGYQILWFTHDEEAWD